MARRQKTNLIEDVALLTAKVPWHIGLIAAIIVFAILHHYAIKPGSPSPAITDLRDIGGNTSRMLFGTLAYLFQFVLPPACLIGAAVSAWRQHRRTGLVTNATGSRAVAAIDAMSWREFEQLVGEGYRLQGYRVLEMGGNGPDGGVDLELTRGNERFLVQCKQ